MIKKNYIPTINISSILEKGFDTKPTLKIVKEIQKACLDVGFFQITGHGIKSVSYTHLTLPTKRIV